MEIQFLNSSTHMTSIRIIDIWSIMDYLLKLFIATYLIILWNFKFLAIYFLKSQINYYLAYCLNLWNNWNSVKKNMSFRQMNANEPFIINWEWKRTCHWDKWMQMNHSNRFSSYKTHHALFFSYLSNKGDSCSVVLLTHSN